MLKEFKSHDEYVHAQERTLCRRGIGPYFTYIEIRKICDWIKKDTTKSKLKGICHGARNGLEADEFKKHLPAANVFGTDLFPFSGKSALLKTNSKVIKHDFSVEKKKWIGKFDFVYCNSLDHARYPEKAILVWMNQLNSSGTLLIRWEPTDGKGAHGGDCFNGTFYEYMQLIKTTGIIADVMYNNVIGIKDRSVHALLRRRAKETLTFIVKSKKWERK